MRAYLESQGTSLKRVVVFIGLTGIAGAVLGVVDRLVGWSDGVSFAVTVVVCTPISLAALGSPSSWFRAPDEGLRMNRRPSS